MKELQPGKRTAKRGALQLKKETQTLLGLIIKTHGSLHTVGGGKPSGGNHPCTGKRWLLPKEISSLKSSVAERQTGVVWGVEIGPGDRPTEPF